ncbi:MAG TPA: glycosyltransferase family 4 protein, partial [Vicinamibacteria bacterium]|nr:glycosyltransferase family 4 protein [Vicinamibacteria bacterium]
LAAARAARSFLADLRSFQPDLLHLNYAGGRLGTMATLSQVRPLVVTVMGGDVLADQHPGGLSRLERRATRRILEQASIILVKSEALRRALDGFGDFAARARTVRWGVDPASFRRDDTRAAELRRTLGLAPTDRVVLSPRLLQPLYNIHLAVEAMPRILAAVPTALLLVTEYQADEAYAARLRRLAAEIGGRVRFIGRIDHTAMPALYSLAEAVVSIPSSDGLPQSLFEAMACGAPIVLGRLPVYEEVVRDGTQALLVPLESSAVADAVRRLLCEPGLGAGLAARARDTVCAEANLEREVGRVEQFYREALAAPIPARSPASRALDALGLLVR